MIHKTHKPEILTIDCRELDVLVYLFLAWDCDWVYCCYLLQWDYYLFQFILNHQNQITNS